MIKDNYKIYIHKNRINGKMYIGQTKQPLERRFLEMGKDISIVQNFMQQFKNMDGKTLNITFIKITFLNSKPIF